MLLLSWRGRTNGSMELLCIPSTFCEFVLFNVAGVAINNFTCPLRSAYPSLRWVLGTHADKHSLSWVCVRLYSVNNITSICVWIEEQRRRFCFTFAWQWSSKLFFLSVSINTYKDIVQLDDNIDKINNCIIHTFACSDSFAIWIHYSKYDMGICSNVMSIKDMLLMHQ